ALSSFLLFTDRATTQIYTLSLHDALPIYRLARARGGAVYVHRQLGLRRRSAWRVRAAAARGALRAAALYPPAVHRHGAAGGGVRSEEHTSELQSLTNLVCRLLLEKKKDHA